MTKKVHAVGVIFEDDGQILVLKRNPRDPEGATWGLPGGKVEPGEDRIAAAAREVQEEIGHSMNPAQLEFLRAYHWDRDDLNITFEVLKLRTAADDIKLEIDQNEHTEHMWASPLELVKRKDLMIGLYPVLEDAYVSNSAP